MNKLRLLNERVILGKEFRVYGDSDNPLFLAKDVAEQIEHNNTTLMVENIEADEKKLDYVIDSSGQRRKSMFLTEEGLYEVLMQSQWQKTNISYRQARHRMSIFGGIQETWFLFKESLYEILMQSNTKKSFRK